jgi:hypothetical protein
MKLKIPGNASQVTLRQFMDYHSASDDVQKVMVIINKNREYCEGLKVETAQTIIELFDEVINAAGDNFERIVTINGKRLAFLPDINGITFREHVDLDQLAQSIWPNGDEPNYKELPQLMAVMFRPIKEQVGDYYNLEKYDLDKTAGYMPEILGLTLDRVNGALLFFSSIGAELVNNSLDSLDAMLAKEMKGILPPPDSRAGGGTTSSKA